MPLWGRSQKNPAEAVRAIRDGLLALDKSEKKSDKALEDISKNLGYVKSMLLGSADMDTASDYQLANLAQEMYNASLLLLLITSLAKIDFEAKKDVAQVFNNLLRRQIGSRFPTVEHICTRNDILFTLMRGYEHQNIALTCGVMLRECTRFESLVKIMLNSDDFYRFFNYVEVSTFDIASDAFSTFKDMLTRHKALSADFLEQNYDPFFSNYQRMLKSENYVTRRQSLKLLGELLLDRHNYTVMTTYIASPDNLKLIMTMLRVQSQNIKFEAFHVFKVFVANPKKPKPILDILVRTRNQLLEFLPRFLNDRTDDEQFNDEKNYLIKQISELKPTEAAPPAATTAATTAAPPAATTATAAPQSTESQQQQQQQQQQQL